MDPDEILGLGYGTAWESPEPDPAELIGPDGTAHGSAIA